MRIVVDTNQLARALARPPEFATFVMAWAPARFTVICFDELLDEYEHVLRYTEPKLTLRELHQPRVPIDYRTDLKIRNKL